MSAAVDVTFLRICLYRQLGLIQSHSPRPFTVRVKSKKSNQDSQHMGYPKRKSLLGEYSRSSGMWYVVYGLCSADQGPLYIASCFYHAGAAMTHVLRWTRKSGIEVTISPPRSSATGWCAMLSKVELVKWLTMCPAMLCR